MKNIYIKNFEHCINTLSCTLIEARDSSYRIAAMLMADYINENNFEAAKKHAEMFKEFIEYYDSLSSINLKEVI